MLGALVILITAVVCGIALGICGGFFMAANDHAESGHLFSKNRKWLELIAFKAERITFAQALVFLVVATVGLVVFAALMGLPALLAGRFQSGNGVLWAAYIVLIGGIFAGRLLGRRIWWVIS
jgi:hypothetical protein